MQLELVPFNVGTLADNLYKTLSYATQSKGIMLKVDLEIDQGLWLLGDFGRIRQILTNLMSNAIKFTKQGSVELTIAGTESNGVVTLKCRVVDTGIGIEREVLNKLFQPFSQGDASTTRLYGGTGLGLSISRSVGGSGAGRLIEMK